MASRSYRPADSGNFLSHNMAPVDPGLPTQSAGHVYEPSTGVPKRDFKRAEHAMKGMDGQMQMMAQPIRSIKTDTAPPYPPQRKRFDEDSGTASQAREFYQGKHTTPHERANPLGIKFLHDNADVATRRQIDQKSREREYSEANWATIQDKRRHAAETRNKFEAPTNDPWDKSVHLVKANDRIPRKALASNGKMFNDGTDTSYAAQVFGKAGGGAPRMRTDGGVETRVHAAFERNEPFDQGPSDTYVGMHLGKHSVERTPSGSVRAHRKNEVATHRIHEQAGGETYVDMVFGKDMPRTSGSGNVRAGRQAALTKADSRPQQANHDPYFGDKFGVKHVGNTRHLGYARQLEKEAAAQPKTFVDRMHDIDRESVNAAHVGVERDSEFATTVAKARAMHKPLPSKA